MKRIVSFGRHPASPFRIIGPNADPDNPGLDDIVFDGNYETLVVMQKGYVDISSVQSVYGSALIPLVRTQPGERPVFTSFSRSRGNSLGQTAPTGPGNSPAIWAGVATTVVAWQWINIAPPWDPPFWILSPLSQNFVQSYGHGFITTPTTARAYTGEFTYLSLNPNTGWYQIINYQRVYYMLFRNTV